MPMPPVGRAAFVPMHRFFNPFGWGIELIYTGIIVLFCFLIYYKTKDLYKLSKHRGISFFRNAFLLFGLAYAFRFVLQLVLLGDITFELFLVKRTFMPLFMLIVTYLSTMAIFFLAFSMLWKRFYGKYMIITSYVIAALISVLAFITRSQPIILLLQLILMLFVVIMSFVGKKYSNTKILYLLLFIFWLLNFFLLGRPRDASFEITMIFQLVSVIVFYIIYHKVNKWTK